MSDHEEYWTDSHGVSVPVSMLTEDEAKAALRIMLKQQREDMDYINSSLAEINNSTEALIKLLMQEPGAQISHPSLPYPDTMDDIDAAFDRAFRDRK